MFDGSLQDKTGIAGQPHPLGPLRLADECAWDPDEVLKITRRGVMQALAAAAERSPFYADRFADLGLRPGDIRDLDDLAVLPPTEKRDVTAQGRRLWACDPDQVLDIVTTSGTTGTPILYPLTAHDLQRLAYNEYLSLTCAGIAPGHAVGLGVTLDKCFMAGLAYYEGLRLIGATSVRIGSGAPAMVLSMIERMGLTAIISVPSYLLAIARFAHQRGFDLRGSSVERLVCIGEPIRDSDGRPTALASRLAEAWDAALVSSYGITELAASMCECHLGCGAHVHPELVHVEVVDDQGDPVPDGQPGELLATTLGVRGMPLLRYRTGDITTLHRGPCACGRATPRLGPIIGRRHHMLKVKGTTVHPSLVVRALSSLPQVEDFVMIARSHSALSDELEVHVVLAGGVAAEALAEITETLRGQLKVRPIVRLAEREQVRQLKNPGELRKDRVFIDERNGNGAGRPD